MIVGVAAAIIIRFAWAPILMAFILVGVTEVKTMAAIILGLVILLATKLQAKLNGKAF